MQKRKKFKFIFFTWKTKISFVSWGSMLFSFKNIIDFLILFHYERWMWNCNIFSWLNITYFWNIFFYTRLFHFNWCRDLYLMVEKKIVLSHFHKASSENYLVHTKAFTSKRRFSFLSRESNFFFSISIFLFVLFKISYKDLNFLCLGA